MKNLNCWPIFLNQVGISPEFDPSSITVGQIQSWLLIKNSDPNCWTITDGRCFTSILHEVCVYHQEGPLGRHLTIVIWQRVPQNQSGTYRSSTRFLDNYPVLLATWIGDQYHRRRHQSFQELGISCGIFLWTTRAPLMLTVVLVHQISCKGRRGSTSPMACRYYKSF